MFQLLETPDTAPSLYDVRMSNDLGQNAGLGELVFCFGMKTLAEETLEKGQAFIAIVCV